jgi:hypothetical protein
MLCKALVVLKEAAGVAFRNILHENRTLFVIKYLLIISKPVRNDYF